ncbi:MAG: peptidoglycan-binding protein [Rickettsiales bacterium]|nr:peptidoglycan-binding protein [Rickettsiales bacterium]
MLPTNITLKMGDSGDYVTELQRRLAGRELLAEMEITGFFDSNTEHAVRTFQSLHALKADGIAGPETIRRLNTFASSDAGGGGDAYNSDGTEEERATGHDRYDEALYMEETIGDHDHINVTEKLDKLEQQKDQKAAARRREEEKELEAEGKIIAEDLAMNREMQAIQEREAQDQAQNMSEQLEITNEHIKAETPIETLSKEQIVETDQPENKEEKAQAAKQEKEAAAKEEQQTKMDHERAEEQGLQTQDQEAQQNAEREKLHGKDGAEKDGEDKDKAQDDKELQQANDEGKDKNGLDPQGQANGIHAENHEKESNVIRFNASMKRVHDSLSPHAQVDTQHEGQHLHAQGVRELPLPPGTRLGELVPTNTPNLSQNRGMGMGM